jgi:alpha-2-macroglobulin
MARLDLPDPAGSRASVTVTNSGKSPLFARLLAKGIPAAGGERPVSNGLALSLRYLGMDGKSLDPAKAEGGDDFIVEATVRNRSGEELKNLALSQLLPSGWEIVNFRVGEELPKPRARDDEGDYEEIEPKAPSPPLYDYQDVRDDRVLTYFSIGTKDPKVFKTYVTKAYDGDFFLPATSVSGMYDERFQAVLPGRWLTPGAATAPSASGAARRSASGSAR